MQTRGVILPQRGDGNYYYYLDTVHKYTHLRIHNIHSYIHAVRRIYRGEFICMALKYFHRSPCYGLSISPRAQISRSLQLINWLYFSTITRDEWRNWMRETWIWLGHFWWTWYIVWIWNKQTDEKQTCQMIIMKRPADVQLCTGLIEIANLNFSIYWKKIKFNTCLIH